MAKVFNVPQVASRLRLYDQRSRAAMRAGLSAGAQRVEAWERANHRWQNQTGNAERGLTCLVADGARGGQDGYRLVNLHGVPYGIYLEFAFQGRYAILREAIWRHWPGVLTDCARRVKGVR
jgi:hypothetical protein